VLLNTLVFNENDTLNSIKVQKDPNDLGDVRLNDTDFTPILILLNLFTNKYMNRSDYERFIDVRLGQRTSDYMTNQHNIIEMPTRLCQQSDF
jgi:hypothetical protein